MGATAQVLRSLPPQTDPNLLVGSDLFDDAGVYRIDGERALVVTVDFFPPLVDDPYVFGQIAAANSLSDIYAMGGKPLTALNIVGFPDKELPVDILGEILRGGAERVTAAGAVIAGGHSVRDTEIKYGLSVTGIVHPDRIFTNAGAKAGDALVLTKPIGSGVLTSAAKAEKIPPDALEEACAVMIDLNAAASEAMIEVGANAATDITGFGLLGHAYELATGANLSVEIDSKSVPLISQALDLAREGVLTRAHKSNLQHLGDAISIEGVEDALVGVLADAQTSGGLLIAVPEDRAHALVADLDARGTKCAAIIGRCKPRADKVLYLR